ncbi:MAG: autotransporter assembly complex protein TamA, partial [Gammaproteobacteria bacterium]
FEEHVDTKKNKSLEQEALAVRKKKKFLYQLSLKYLSELYQLDKFQDRKKSSLLLPGFGISWRKMDKQQGDIRNGFKFSMDARMALNLLFSSTNIVQTEFNTLWIKSFSDTFKLKVRQTTGITYAPVVDKIPLSLRFFAGGDQSIRGYPYKSLGPSIVNAEGETIVTGGRYLIINSLEAERALKGPVWLAAFFDNGNAFQRFADRFKNSAGLGLRFKTPVGPLKLDCAFPLEKKPKNKFRLHLNFGLEM